MAQAMDGCPCDASGRCEGGLVCDDAADRCRPPRTCAEACAPRQRCELPADGPAVCLEACDPGFTWAGGACVPMEAASCMPDAAGSIAAECAELNRRCLEMDGGAACGACVADHTDEAGALRACRPVRTCASLACEAADRECQAGAPGADAACGDCLPGNRPEGEACVPDVGSPCAAGTPLAEQCATEHRRCAEDDGGRCGACLPGFVEEGGACREDVAVDCADLECDAEHRACVEDAAGARCADCLAGFRDDAGACVPDAACNAAACRDLGRACAPRGAECSECLDGLFPSDPDDDGSPCRAILPCAEDTCPEGTFCRESPPGLEPVCTERPCADFEALRINVNDAGVEVSSRCVPCDGLLCGDEGETGEIWPHTVRNSDQCICTTEAGYYYDQATRSAEPCDDDADGWPRSPVQAALNDPELTANVRCLLPEIDRFVMENELGQQRAVLLCAGEPLVVDPADPDAPECERLAPVRLFEPEVSDADDNLPGPAEWPAYAAGGIGRALRAREVNPMTKACVAGADFNFNGIDDARESQDAAIDPGVLPESLQVFTRFSYFIELHDAFYEPGSRVGRRCAGDEDACLPGVEYCDAGGECRRRLGRYVIRERSRREPDFPPVYHANESDYWRQCTRNRDAAWDVRPGVPFVAIGFDFARYGCDPAHETGPCPVAPPPAGPALGAEVPPHGFGDVALPPADGIWRGMNHHSQFRCITVTDDARDVDPRGAPHIVHEDDLYDGGAGSWQADRCHVRCPAGDLACEADCAGDGCATSAVPGVGVVDNPAHPIVVCDPVVDARAGEVLLAAARYPSTAEVRPYERGCIDEWAPAPSDDAVLAAWRGLCPGYIDSPTPFGVSGVADPTRFGKLLCGCNQYFGGATCEIGCASPLYGGVRGTGEAPFCLGDYCPQGTPDDPRRTGTWVCGGVTRTSGADPVVGALSSRGNPLDMDVDPEGYVSEHDLSPVTGWVDGGQDAFDAFGAVQIRVGDPVNGPFWGTTVGVADQRDLGPLRVRSRFDFPHQNVLRYRLDAVAGPRDGVVTVEVSGNVGSDGNARGEPEFLPFAGSQFPYLAETDASGADPPVLTLLVPGHTDDLARVVLRRRGDVIYATATDVHLPVTVYIAPGHRPAPEVLAVILSQDVGRTAPHVGTGPLSDGEPDGWRLTGDLGPLGHPGFAAGAAAVHCQVPGDCNVGWSLR